MADQTLNYGLIKPGANEYYDINIENKNMDIIDAELKNRESETEGVRENTENVLTSILSQHQSIFSAGTGIDEDGVAQDIRSLVKGGQSKVKIRGFTTNSLVKNGDLSNGINNWTAYKASPLSIIDGAVTTIATENSGGVYQTPPGQVVGHKYYVSAQVKSSSNKVFLSFKDRVYHSGSGKFERLSNLITLEVTGHWFVAADTRTSGWDAIYLKDCICINLTSQFSLGKEPTKEQCDFMYDHYVNGLQGVGSHKIISTNKNIFNPDTISVRGEYITDDATVTDNAWCYTQVVLNLKPYTTYTMSGFTNLNTAPYFRFYNKYMQHVGSVQYSGKSKLTFMAPPDCYGFRASIPIADINNIQLEEGSVATEYEPYRSSQLAVTLLPSGPQMYSLPNGVEDIIEEIDGVYSLIKRVGDKTLTDADIGLVEELTTISLVSISSLSSLIGGSSYVNNIILENFSKVNTDTYTDNISSIGKFYLSPSRVLILGVAKGTTLTQARQMLVGSKVVYELASPKTYKSVDNDFGFKMEGNLEVFDKGYIYQIGDTPKQCSVAPIEITYNLTDKAVEMTNNKGLSSLYKSLRGRLKSSYACIENGLLSHAEGLRNVANGHMAHAEGWANYSGSRSSHVEGILNFGAHGTLYNVTAFNNTNKTVTLNNVTGLVVGDLLIPKISGSVTTLLDSKITAINGLVVTLSTTSEITSAWANVIKPHASDFPVHAEGRNNIAVGEFSHVEGRDNIASGSQSHVEGVVNVASGDSSHAEGGNNKASGPYTHTEGYFNTAAGDFSHAEGYGTQANGRSSHTEGQSNIADGANSHAGGFGSIAQVEQSFVHGYSLRGNGNDQAVFGRYNSPSTTDLFQVGNGTSDSARSNAFTVYTGGAEATGFTGSKSMDGYYSRNIANINSAGINNMRVYYFAAAEANSYIHYNGMTVIDGKVVMLQGYELSTHYGFQQYSSVDGTVMKRYKNNSPTWTAWMAV